MKERSILFSGPMVRAIIEGRKTQTRRVVKAMSARQAEWLTPALIDSVVALDVGRWECGFGVSLEHPGGGPLGFVRCPFGAPGDRLWVRETWHQCPHCRPGRVCFRSGGWVELPSGAPDDGGDRDDADARPLAPKCAAHGWRPSIYMPRWASRITLEVMEVRVERLQAISEADACEEGVEANVDDGVTYYGPLNRGHADPRVAFQTLWESIQGGRPWRCWASNPWVWVVSFRRLPLSFRRLP